MADFSVENTVEYAGKDESGKADMRDRFSGLSDEAKGLVQQKLTPFSGAELTPEMRFVHTKEYQEKDPAGQKAALAELNQFGPEDQNKFVNEFTYQRPNWLSRTANSVSQFLVGDPKNPSEATKAMQSILPTPKVSERPGVGANPVVPYEKPEATLPLAGKLAGEIGVETAKTVPYILAPEIAAIFKNPWARTTLTSAINAGYRKIAQNIGLEGGDVNQFDAVDALNIGLPFAATAAEKAFLKAAAKNPTLKEEAKLAKERIEQEAKATAKTNLTSQVEGMQPVVEPVGPVLTGPSGGAPAPLTNETGPFSVEKPVMEGPPTVAASTVPIKAVGVGFSVNKPSVEVGRGQQAPPITGTRSFIGKAPAEFSVAQPVTEVNPAAGFTAGSPKVTTPVVEAPAVVPEAQLRKTWSEGFAELPESISAMTSKAIKGHRALPAAEKVEAELTKLFPENPAKVAETLAKYNESYGLYKAEKNAFVEGAKTTAGKKALTDRVDAATLELDSALSGFPQALKDSIRLGGKVPAMSSVRKTLIYSGLESTEAGQKAAKYMEAVDALEAAQEAAGHKVSVARPIKNVQTPTVTGEPVAPRPDVRTLPKTEAPLPVEELPINEFAAPPNPVKDFPDTPAIAGKAKALQSLDEAVTKGKTEGIRKALNDNASALSPKEVADLSAKLDVIEKAATPEAAEIAKSNTRQAVDDLMKTWVGTAARLPLGVLKDISNKFLTSQLGREVVRQKALTNRVMGPLGAAPNIVQREENPGFGEALKRGVMSLQDRGNPPIMPGALLRK